MDIWTQLAKFAFFDTQALELRPFQYADHQAFYNIVSDSQNFTYVFSKKMTKQESDYLLVHGFIKNSLGIWAIQDKMTGQMIGAIKLEKYNPKKASTEIGYFLNKAYWGQGIMTEVLKTLCFLCFQEFGLKKLVLVIHLENRASQRVAEKAGFQLAKRFKGSDRHSHQMRDYLAYHLKIGNDYYE
ncbi:GNAT family N-acetyltransferase [Streptococcus castoreus]|uniref:GNAT family N-acetyltransferase n=1 Tax=Streptococcus castoreus TaxID=254786 RepID=UPI000411E3CD|nr:GNAT family protein [Streptococcus castoreus]